MNFKMVLTFILTLSNKTDACLKVIADDFKPGAQLNIKNTCRHIIWNRIFILNKHLEPMYSLLHFDC
jgi:hypothetical protein